MIKAYDGLNYATFEEWSKGGFRVRKGQKSQMVDETSFAPLFSEKQVDNILEGCPDPAPIIDYEEVVSFFDIH